MNETPRQANFVLVPDITAAETGNSRLRALFKNPVESIASSLTEHYPNLTASHITAAGTIACLGAAVSAAKAPGIARYLSWVHLGGSLSDALDGPVARSTASKNGTQTSSSGALFDTLNDRIQEYGAAISQADIAFARGNRFGGVMLLAAAVTGPVPSLARSNAEAHGIVVQEGLIGSRHTRVTLNCLGYHLNEHSNIVSGMAVTSTALNLFNAGTRLSALQPGSRHNVGQLEIQKQDDAIQRRRMLGVLTTVFAVGSVVKARRALAATN